MHAITFALLLAVGAPHTGVGDDAEDVTAPGEIYAGNDDLVTILTVILGVSGGVFGALIGATAGVYGGGALSSDPVAPWIGAIAVGALGAAVLGPLSALGGWAIAKYQLDEAATLRSPQPYRPQSVSKETKSKTSKSEKRKKRRAKMASSSRTGTPAPPLAELLGKKTTLFIVGDGECGDCRSEYDLVHVAAKTTYLDSDVHYLVCKTYRCFVHFSRHKDTLYFETVHDADGTFHRLAEQASLGREFWDPGPSLGIKMPIKIVLDEASRVLRLRSLRRRGPAVAQPDAPRIVRELFGRDKISRTELCGGSAQDCLDRAFDAVREGDDEAAEPFARAACVGDEVWFPGGCNELSGILKRRGRTRDATSILKFLCESQGYFCDSYAMKLWDGDGTKEDRKEASRVARLACSNARVGDVSIYSHQCESYAYIVKKSGFTIASSTLR